ncbi:MAPEG family protein [Ferrimonas balearica]|uniref:MAPEG family protein n=1 Tax=Ferrimonas balearica TaxID=44012 RepID=UPI001C564684|nr:MAPEG family protein [Ferrimonas balearica]MBW3163872.1 MAPEG family protein [Ferrimonas balearica]
MALQWTGVYAAWIGLISLALAWGVVQQRRALKVGVGDADNRDLQLRVRAHANLIEYAPIALILLGCIEASGGPLWLVHGAGATLVLGRVLHPWGLVGGNGGYHLGRLLGTLLTWLAILVPALYLLVNPLL